MLRLVLPATDTLSAIELEIEHSLVSLSKWEQLYEKPFFGKEEKTEEESVDYFRQMILTPNVPDDIFDRFDPAHYEVVNKYINAKASATWFQEQAPGRGTGEVITSELIYYWMVSFNIPFIPTETWHFNRLMTLIRICGVKQTKPKKMSRSAMMAQQRRLNEERRQQLGTNG